MSKSGSQIDRLRTAAQTERTLGNYEFEQMLLDAADTITELRKDLEFANNECEKDSIEFLNLQDENAKLRELMAKQAKILGVGTGWCYADCAREFECDMDECKIESAMNELGMAHELAALLGVKKGADA